MADDALWDKAGKWLNRIDECETGGDKVSLMCRLMGEYEKELSAVEAERDRMREALEAWADGFKRDVASGNFVSEDSHEAMLLTQRALTPPQSEKPKCDSCGDSGEVVPNNGTALVPCAVCQKPVEKCEHACTPKDLCRKCWDRDMCACGNPVYPGCGGKCQECVI